MATRIKTLRLLERQRLNSLVGLWKGLGGLKAQSLGGLVMQGKAVLLVGKSV